MPCTAYLEKAWLHFGRERRTNLDCWLLVKSQNDSSSRSHDEVRRQIVGCASAAWTCSLLSKHGSFFVASTETLLHAVDDEMIPPLEPVITTALIFGGCCTNVFALEAIVK